MEKQLKRGFSRLRGDSGQHHRVLAVMMILGVLGFVPVGFRLYRLMVTEYDYYVKLALRNQTRSTAVTADRGTIYDRNMDILACSESVEDVYLDPHELKQAGEDIGRLSLKLGEILQMDPGIIEKKAGDLSYRYQRIASRIEAETAAGIRAYLDENQIVGVHLEPNSRRVYPYGSLAAQVIGFTNVSNVGSEGVEAAYDAYLSGKAGKVITTKGNNEMDMPFSYENYVTSQEGCSVVLTLDTTIQACLEKQMAAAIDRYDIQNGAFGIVMNVNTGEILAMATLGSFDPNRYSEIADQATAEYLEQLRKDWISAQEGTEEYNRAKSVYQNSLTEARLKQWRNRCISDGYEPGSTFKVMTMAAALDTGAIDLQTNFFCSGAEQIPGRAQLLHCWRSAGHGAQQTPQALQNSCNLAFAHIALKLGGEQFYEYVQRFGILEKTGIDLAGESKGIFFDRSLVTDTDKWGTASLTSGSFGQTFKITPLQLVRGIASVVNGGMLMEPYIVSEILDSQGNTVLKQEPTMVRRTIREETSQVMRELIKSVVTDGTAKNANVSGYSIGGKTGTSEKIDVFDENGQRVLDKIVSFVGIAPMENPEYIVLVALDTPSRSTGIYISGGVMAAPTVGAVLADILPYLGVERTEEVRDYQQQVVLDDLKGMTRKEAKAQLESLGLAVRFVGDGDVVIGQLPAGGNAVPGGSQILVYMEEPSEQTEVEVPDFMGMNRQQAVDAAGQLGLYVLVTGNNSVAPGIVVTEQKVLAKTMVPQGTTIELVFTDTRILN